MTQTEKALKWLREEYGITTEQELDRALARTKLDIGIFVSPLPEIIQEGMVKHDNSKCIKTA